MRPQDTIEVIAQTGLPVVQAIEQAITHSSRFARLALIDLEPLAVFGLAHLTLLGDSAQVWCFGTRYIDTHPHAFARESVRVVRQMHRLASTLTNYVDEEDAQAAKWLTWLGASFVLQPKPLNGRLFAQFVLTHRGKACQQG